ncbi:calcium uptake protein 3, mitochondrial isoform X4 [Electrophorus electricus]|uniref:calcium uptake protein 3, mitochondrial isoform X4 n=1 Tax=Electrophorus electricus TaxID=8005 RepID=UPI000F09FCDB|nr:calcium uptake protein 3, mitochondrial isoform X4 [Electrophorus electricus]
MMAAVRQFISAVNKFSTCTKGRSIYFKSRPSFKVKGALIQAATGLSVVVGGIAVYQHCTTRDRLKGGNKIRDQHALINQLPAVAAKEKIMIPAADEGMAMSAHEQRFRWFSSVEYEGQLYMTPLDFIESVTTSEPKKKKFWRSLIKEDLDKFLSDTPPVWKGSSRLFRNLHDRGIISYTEYLFLLCILTKPHAGFRIAFNMFDADGNEKVDKREFMVLEEIFRKKNEKKERRGDSESSSQLHVQENITDTTLLVHFFGKKGKTELNFEDFYRFMDNLQTEMLEIEFLAYSKGMVTISAEDFARILLRFTTVDHISSYLENVRRSMPDEKGITFEEFRTFFQFLNNLEDFTIALQMYNFASRSIGQDEFARAVYVATGLKLSRHLVDIVFRIFDVDLDDQLSYKEFTGIMRGRLHRGSWGYRGEEKFISFKACLKKELSGK